MSHAPACVAGRYRRTKQKRHTGTDTVDLFLDKLADESRRCEVPESERHLCLKIIPGK
jgi:hypothetical protein